MSDSIRLAKEAFVTGHSGTSLSEICCATALIPLLAVVQLRLVPRLQSTTAAYLANFALLVLPQLAVLLNAVKPQAALLSASVLAAGLAYLSRAQLQQDTHARSLLWALAQPRLRFLSWYRGAVLLCACIGILAVDFRVFPRRWAKAETFGTGLMDTGVSCFVFASGLVSRYARVDAADAVGAEPVTQRLRSALRSAGPLLVLGLLRPLATKASAYQEHVTEYGVHWNFFLTQAVVILLTALVNMPPDTLIGRGVAIAFLHQVVLSLGALRVLHSAERGAGLLSANKEGLMSLPGYWALYLLAAGLGRHLRLTGRQLADEVATQERRGQQLLVWGAVAGWWLHLALADVALWGLLALLLRFLQPVSRRAANAPYIVWTLAYNLLLLLLCMLAEAATAERPAPAAALVPASSAAGSQASTAASAGLSVKKRKILAQAKSNLPASNAAAIAHYTAAEQQGQAGADQPQGSREPLPLLAALGGNMLPLFLLANLLTGAINLSVNTLEVGDWEARASVADYVAVICLAAALLHQRPAWTRLQQRAS